MKNYELTIPLTEKQNIEVYKTEKYYVHTNYGKLLDVHMGNTAFIFGFDNPHIKSRMRELQDKIAYLHCKPNEHCKEHDDLIETICGLGDFFAVAWAVSGSDGVECAISMNDAYWKYQGKDKQKLICFFPGWHGTTYINRAMRKEETLDKLVILDAPQWKDITLRESQEQKLLQQIETAINNDPTIGAIIYESIPWLWGMTPWSKEFHVKLRTLCDKYDLNLILDDVMGGIGKLGKYFSHQQFGITPDIAVLGKAFTGGFSPLSCACANARISEILKDKNMYSHTWQPNMAGVGAALGVIDVFDESLIVTIESRLHEFGNHLLGEGLIKRFVCEGLIFFADPVRQIHSDDFIENGITGLAGWEYEAKNISLIAPVIADDEYFDELTKRMLKSLKS